jgi:hypothetical protein
LQRAGAQLGAAQVGLDFAFTPQFALRPAEVVGHCRPNHRTIMSAVDAHYVHPGGEQITH